MEYNKGVWRTVRGRKIYIRDGQSLQDAMIESWKFSSKRHPTLWLEKQEYSHVISELNTYFSSFENKKIHVKAVGNCMYIFENHGFDDYNIFDKLFIDASDDNNDVSEYFTK